MSVLEIYLNEFYNDPYNIEEYKINFIKNYYYPIVNIVFKTDLKNFRIGVTKNKEILWFNDIKKPNIEIIYYKKNKLYYINKNKNKRNFKLINFDKYEENKNYDTCLIQCVLL